MTCNHCEWRGIDGLCLWPRGCPRAGEEATAVDGGRKEEIPPAIPVSGGPGEQPV